MLKKIHNYLNFVTILLIISLLVGFFYSVLTYDPTAIIDDISNIITMLTPEASVWLDALMKNLDAIQKYTDIIFIGFFTILMIFYIVVPLFNFFINRKKDLRISRIGLSIVIEVLMIIFMFMIMSSFVFDAYYVVDMFGVMIILVALIQIILCIILAYKWYKLAVKNGTLGIQLINTVGFLVKAVSVVLIIYFTTNVAITLVTNFATDILISNIHVAQMIGSNIIEIINFDIPLNELLPERIVTFFSNNGFPLTKTLSELGITNETVGTLLNSYVFAPIDGFIQNALDDFTNNFIFRDFTMRVLILALTVATFITYQIKMIPLIIRQIITVISFTAIAFILLFILNYFLFVNIIVLILVFIVSALIVLIVKTIIEMDATQELINKEAEKIRNTIEEGEN